MTYCITSSESKEVLTRYLNAVFTAQRELAAAKGHEAPLAPSCATVDISLAETGALEAVLPNVGFGLLA